MQSFPKIPPSHPSQIYTHHPPLSTLMIHNPLPHPPACKKTYLFIISSYYFRPISVGFWKNETTEWAGWTRTRPILEWFTTTARPCPWVSLQLVHCCIFLVSILLFFFFGPHYFPNSSFIHIISEQFLLKNIFIYLLKEYEFFGLHVGSSLSSLWN